MMTIERIEIRIKEEGKKYGSELTDIVLGCLRNNLGVREHTAEVLNNTYNMIPSVFEQASKK